MYSIHDTVYRQSLRITQCTCPYQLPNDAISLVGQFPLGALTLRLRERMPNCNQTFEMAMGVVAPQDTEVS